MARAPTSGVHLTQPGHIVTPGVAGANPVALYRWRTANDLGRKPSRCLNLARRWRSCGGPAHTLAATIRVRVTE